MALALAALLLSASPAPAQVTLPSGAIAVPDTGSFFYVKGDAADWVGHGQERLFGGDSVITATIDAPHTYLIATANNGWYVHLAAPEGEPLQVGSYTGATRAGFRAPGTPGIDLYGGGRGCNTVTGDFDVLAIQYDEGGNLTLFDATFVQHCGGDPSFATYGRVRYDAHAPTVSITDSPDKLTPDDAATFSLASSADDAAFECKLDDAPYAACSSPITYPEIADGAHEFSMRATSDGHTSGPARWTWTISPTAVHPSVTLPSGTIAIPETGSFLYLHSTGQGDWVGQGQETLYTANTTTFFTATPQWAPYQAITTTLSEGLHDWTVFVTGMLGRTLGERAYAATRGPDLEAGTAGLDVYGDGRGCNQSFSTVDVLALQYDEDGNVILFDATFEQHCERLSSPPLFGRIRYDALAPTVAITDTPAARTTADNASFGFASQPGGTSFDCKLDDASFSACVSPQTYSGLAEGDHLFTVKATKGGHTSAPTTYAWTVDRSPPETSITAHPTNPSNETAPTFVFGASEDASFQCALDGGPFADCTSPRTLSGLAQGEHIFQVVATDTLGHIDPSAASFVWNVDTTPPDTTIVTKPAALSNQASPQFSFSSNEAGATFECKIEGGPFTACGNPTTFPGLTQGTHTMQVRAKDPASNVDDTPALYTWSIDSVPPPVAITSHPDSPTRSKSATFAFANEAGAALTCKVDDANFARCSSPKTYPKFRDGSHTFVVNAVDAAGNSAQASFTWTIDRTPPQTTISSYPPNPTASTSADFDFSSSEPGSTFECKLDRAPFSACTGPVSLAGLTRGKHSFRVRAADPVGNLDRSPAAFTWMIR